MQPNGTIDRGGISSTCFAPPSSGLAGFHCIIDLWSSKERGSEHERQSRLLPQRTARRPRHIHGARFRRMSWALSEPGALDRNVSLTPRGFVNDVDAWQKRRPRATLVASINNSLFVFEGGASGAKRRRLCRIGAGAKLVPSRSLRKGAI